MTDWSPWTREFKPEFLGEGTWQAQIYADGANAVRFASDFRLEKRTISAGDKIRLELAPGGGWVAVIRR